MSKCIKFFSALIFIVFTNLGFSQTLDALKIYENGIQKQRNEDFFGASEDFQQVLQLNPSYGDAWYHLSEVTYLLGDFSLALTYIESAEKFAKNNTEIMNLKGMTYISLGQLDNARKVFEEVLKKYPNDVDSRFGLAELDLYSGSFIGAKNLYEDALKRQSNNRKALLSLAILSAEEKNDVATEKYIEQALRFYSDDPYVHYLAAYLAAKKGDYTVAEKRARSSVQINGDFIKSYELLSQILYAQKRYDEVIDICDYLIAKNRNNSQSWYLKGLSQYRKNEIEDAVETWDSGLSVNERDEVMRAALELTVMKMFPIEDPRRNDWAVYHAEKGRDYAKSFLGEEARYEYQLALKLNPYNNRIRNEFADLLNKSGINEIYLDQLKFIKNVEKQGKNSSSDDGALHETGSIEAIRVNDTIEAYESLMKYSLSSKWDVEPFYLDKIRWHVGIYYTKSPVQLIHSDAEEIAAGMAANIFSGISSASVAVENMPVSGYGEAYRLARKNNLDYFILLSIDESEREVTLSAVVYSARTGTETTRFSSFRTGNDSFASVLRAFRRDVMNMLPVRGKIIQRSVNEILVDLGTVEGIKENAVLDVIKAGKIQTSDKGLGVTFDEKNLLGKITIKRTGEEISEGVLEQKGFYDRVNVGDEVLVNFLPGENESSSSEILDNTPAAGEDGKRILPENRKKLSLEELGLVKTSAVIELIRNLKN